MAKLEHPIREAERYLQNARDILSEKADKEGNAYKDPKYVKMAGNTAWNGVLVALDAVLPVKGGRRRPDFKDYLDAIAKKDRKMTRTILEAYEYLHKNMGYDGELDYMFAQKNLALARDILAWAERHLPSECNL
jgi:hypothetical protein